MKKESQLYSSVSQGFNENNDCSVRAMTIVSGKPYAEIHALLKKHGRHDKRGAYWSTVRHAADELGWTRLKENEFCNVTNGSYYPTLAQFIARHPVGKFQLHRNGHAFALIDGVVHDWSRGTGPRSRIVGAWKAA